MAARRTVSSTPLAHTPVWLYVIEQHMCLACTVAFCLLLFAGMQVRTVCTMAADFGWPMWVFGHATYTLVDDTHILALLQDPKVNLSICLN